MQFVSFGDKLHGISFHAICLLWRQIAWNAKASFLEKKNTKNILKCRLLKLKYLPSMLSVNFDLRLYYSRNQLFHIEMVNSCHPFINQQHFLHNASHMRLLKGRVNNFFLQITPVLANLISPPYPSRGKDKKKIENFHIFGIHWLYRTSRYAILKVDVTEIMTSINVIVLSSHYGGRLQSKWLQYQKPTFRNDRYARKKSVLDVGEGWS